MIETREKKRPRIEELCGMKYVVLLALVYDHQDDVACSRECPGVDVDV